MTTTVASDIGKRLRNMTLVLAVSELGKEEILAIAADADALIARLERERDEARRTERSAGKECFDALVEARSELAAVVAASSALTAAVRNPSSSMHEPAALAWDHVEALDRTLASLSDAARARDEALRAEGREQAAKVCDEEQARWTDARGPLANVCAANLAAGIRALRADKDGTR